MVNIIKRYRNTNGGYDSIVTDGEHIVLIEDCTMTCYSKAAFAEIVKLCINNQGMVFGYIYLGKRK